MKENEQNKEQTILEAAEAEFLEKGYDGAKMLSIARRAGVAHSMLHYLLTQVPQMPYFLLSEMLLKPENRAMVIGLLERVEPIQRVKEMLEAEIEAGRIRSIQFGDFLFMLLTFDTASLTAISACREKEGIETEVAERLIASYREHNMQLILEALKP